MDIVQLEMMVATLALTNTTCMTRNPTKVRPMIPFRNTRSLSCVSAVDTPVIGLVTAHPPSRTALNNPSHVTGNKTSSSQNPISPIASCSMYADHAWTPLQTTAATFAHYLATQPTQHAIAPEIDPSSILYRHVTPYNPNVWHLALQYTGLISLFPNLIHNLIHGAPIGNLPPLSYTFIPDNLTSTNIDMIYMDNFLVEEVTSGRMDSPFSIETAHHIFKGHFRTTPLGFIEKPGLNTLCLI